MNKEYFGVTIGEIREDPDLRNRTLIFKNRRKASKELANKLEEYSGTGGWVLAIPSGGVPIGVELSKHLECKFDLIIVRKIHVPWNPEAGFGSITWTGETFFNESLLQRLDLSQEKIEQQIEAEEREIEKRMNKFRGDVPFPNLEGESIIIADDGMASGFSMLAAVESVKNKDPGKIVAAVPTASESSIERIGPEVDELIALNIRTGPRFAVADAYEDWYDLGDEDVIRLLEESKRYRAVLGGKN